MAHAQGQGLEQRVHPCMVDREKPVAQVMGVLNAVVAEGDFVGSVAQCATAQACYAAMLLLEGTRTVVEAINRAGGLSGGGQGGALAS